MKLLLLIFKNVRRNALRSVLTSLGTMVLVLVITLVWSGLSLIERVTTEQSQNLKMIISEKWRFPSQMPIRYADLLSRGGYEKTGDAKPTDSMVWQFYGGTLDPKKKGMENMVFAFGMDADKLATMMDELESLPEGEKKELLKTIERLKAKKDGIILGRDRRKMINREVGEKFILHGLNQKDINLEFEVVGEFPRGRYDLSAAMNRKYLNDELDKYDKKNPSSTSMSEKSLSLVWLRLPDQETFNRVSDQIMTAYGKGNPAVKCETAATGIATFLEPFKDIIWGMKWLLTPAVIVTLSLVIANAISISVRERRTELAVMKVLGFRPVQILLLVLGEALLLGVGAGLLSAVLAYGVINFGFGGVPFPIGFIPKFFIQPSALWWGVAVGAGAALAGSIGPAIAAQNVKVAEVFAKVA
jgi:putative ABC transport system permease protein